MRWWDYWGQGSLFLSTMGTTYCKASGLVIHTFRHMGMRQYDVCGLKLTVAVFHPLIKILYLLEVYLEVQSYQISVYWSGCRHAIKAGLPSARNKAGRIV